MFEALSAGLTGTPSMSGFKSKGEALKYAIEFTTQWKEGEKIINFTAAEELYKFICKNVELPETFDDGLSSFFKRVGETIEEEKRNREKLEELKNPLRDEEAGEEPDVAEKETQDEEMEKVCEDEELAEVDLTVEGFVEGEEPADLRRSSLRSIYNDFVRKCVENGLINFQGSSIPGGMVESYTRKNGREYLKVTLEHGIAPKPEKE